MHLQPAAVDVGRLAPLELVGVVVVVALAAALLVTGLLLAHRAHRAHRAGASGGPPRGPARAPEGAGPEGPRGTDAAPLSPPMLPPPPGPSERAGPVPSPEGDADDEAETFALSLPARFEPDASGDMVRVPFDGVRDVGAEPTKPAAVSTRHLFGDTTTIKSAPGEPPPSEALPDGRAGGGARPPFAPFRPPAYIEVPQGFPRPRQLQDLLESLGTRKFGVYYQQGFGGTAGYYELHVIMSDGSMLPVGAMYADRYQNGPEMMTDAKALGVLWGRAPRLLPGP